MIDDKAAFAERNIGLARSCVKRFMGKGIEYEELYSAACLGLMKAIAGFDDSRGVCFSTYAVPVIFGELKQLFRASQSVRLSRELYKRSCQAKSITEDFMREHNRTPRLSELAELMGITPEEAAQAVCAAQPVLSLTQYDGEEESQQQIPIGSFEGEVLDRNALRQALTALDEGEQNLIVLRYIRGLTQSAAAKLLNTTQVGVSRREKKILLKLREQLA